METAEGLSKHAGGGGRACRRKGLKTNLPRRPRDCQTIKATILSSSSDLLIYRSTFADMIMRRFPHATLLTCNSPLLSSLVRCSGNSFRETHIKYVCSWHLHNGRD
ncbi:hypothetical protein PV10_00103 [Exophiala mesophila]|uniref:Uncharacterized protein n=1 Tax=Exophiala mesophila TaxID=212818 RepID=A0A0D1ZNI6_EXOME|nr:uncharacterized protein PV10_00103 [Exophiala mesophila]KIV96212.1 hypothetical protein PV10_00103 [Exophiala mesophila]